MSTAPEAEQAFNDKKYKLSIDLYRAAVQEEPDNPLLYQGLAQSLLHARAYEQAETASTRALELNPNLFLAYVVRAYAYYNMKDLKSFRIDAQKTYELNPNSAESLTCYGTMLLVDKDWDRSIEILSKAIAIDSSYVWAYNGLALALFQKGDARNAFKQTKRMFLALPTIKTGAKLISAFHQAYPYVILAAVALHSIYYLLPPLFYVIYGIWISIRLVLTKQLKSGTIGIVYSILMLTIPIFYLFHHQRILSKIQAEDCQFRGFYCLPA